LWLKFFKVCKFTAKSIDRVAAILSGLLRQSYEEWVIVVRKCTSVKNFHSIELSTRNSGYTGQTSSSYHFTTTCSFSQDKLNRCVITEYLVVYNLNQRFTKFIISLYFFALTSRIPWDLQSDPKRLPAKFSRGNRIS
jgi:hypothetical protein